jgi:putative ABC transport system substrate-binding protein
MSISPGSTRAASVVEDARARMRRFTGLHAIALTCAQRAAQPVIGFLGSPSAVEWVPFVTAFQRGLKETGYIEGENVAIEYRWADGQYDRLPALAADLIRRQVAVIFAAGSAAPAIAAKGATTSVPIVFAHLCPRHRSGSIRLGREPQPARRQRDRYRLSRCGVGEKALALIHELVPNVAAGGMFINPNNPNAELLTRTAQETARSLGVQVHILNAGTVAEIDAAFANLREQGIGMLAFGADPFLLGRREQFVALAARQELPAIYFALASLSPPAA